MQSNTSPIVVAARWSARHPWRAIGLWVALVVGAVVAGGAMGIVNLTDGQQLSGESARAERTIESAKLRDAIQEHALVRRGDGGALGAADLAAAQDVAKRIKTLQTARNVTPAVTSRSGTAAIVTWELAREDPTALAPTRRVLATVEKQHPDLRIEQVGDVSIQEALDDAVGDDLSRAERLSLPITLVILLVAFGALIAALMPLLLAISCVALAVGLTAVASHVTPVSDAINSVILLIGLAVGVDYSMFFMRRTRDERARGATSIDAVEIAAEIGRAHV